MEASQPANDVVARRALALLELELARMGSDACIASFPLLVDEIAGEVAASSAEVRDVRAALQRRLGLLLDG